jgi:hypothetical protein
VSNKKDKKKKKQKNEAGDVEEETKEGVGCGVTSDKT